MDITQEAIQYDIDALRANIGKIGKNIKVFEEAISNEREQMERIRQMITVLEEKKSTVK